MKVREHLKQMITGLTIPQEYVCLQTAEIQNPIAVFLELNAEMRLDITTSHLFLGYKPLVIGLIFKHNDPNFEVVRNQLKISLRFENFFGHKFHPLANLVLRKIKEKKLDDVAVFLYEGELGTHSFLSPMNQWINRQREKIKRPNPDNVNLPGNLIDQVRITYSVPRNISIITINDGTFVNMFPTDLHGPIGKQFYASSLRLGGKANDQVEKFSQLVISEVESAFYKQAYALGKNHMKELKKENEFPVQNLRSTRFNSPLPISATQYRELRRVDFFDIGIHRIHFYKVIHHQLVQEKKSSLSHVHQYYAQWRLDHGLSTSLLLC